MDSALNDYRHYSAMERMNRKKLIPLIITLVLFFIPFFWFKPGEMDTGGDSSRLYFYDPISYLNAQALYGIIPSGIGGEAVTFYAIPYMLLIAAIKYFIASPTILIAIFHGMSLSVAFFSCYLILKEFLHTDLERKKIYVEIASVLSGLFYIFSPTLVLGWDKEILTHNQIFLNPLMFLLCLRFFTRNNKKYLFTALLISFIFAPNFSFVAAPPFFAFYPISIVFLLFYTKIILKKPIPFKMLLVGLFLFILLQLFHLGANISSLFVGGSNINQNVFSADAIVSRGLSYFLGVSKSVKVSFSWMNLAQLTEISSISYAFILFPFITLLGFIWNKKRLFLLTAIFFLITFFLVTANITDVAFNFYVKLFDIPGFSMFRNYFGQWLFVFTFFYMLLFGQALEIIFERIKIRYIAILSIVICTIFVINGWPFINGSLLNKIHYQSKNVKIPSEMDPVYIDVLSYIHNLDTDGKFISFPLTGPGYQILTGKNGGAYQGPSTISYLTGKNDFTGYDGLIPFNETFLTLVKNNDSKGINRLFSLLNIKYVFYNSDPSIYDDSFPKYPYDFVRDKMPRDQNAYKSFIAKLPIHKVKDFGEKYHIYEVNQYLPHIYTSNDYVYATDAITPFFVLNLDKSSRTVVYTEKGHPKENDAVILKALNVNPLLQILDNYHLHVHDPFISRRMDDIFYPIVVWKEKKSLQAKTTLHVDYIDYSLLYLTKRISELRTYDETPITHKDFIEPRLWEIWKWKDYYSWEANLTRYETDAKKLISWVATIDASDSDKTIMKIKINENISQHQLQLIRIITESKYTEEDKKYLMKKEKVLFESLYQTLAIQPINSFEIPYTLDVPKELYGQYNIYLRSANEGLLDPVLYAIKINNEVLKPKDTTKKSSLVAYSPVAIKETNAKIILLYQPQNVYKDTGWIGAGKITSEANGITFAIDNQLGVGSGFSKKVDNYEPATQYVVTFDYYTEGEDSLFRLYEKQNQNGRFNSTTYFNKILSSKTWKTQQSILTSSPDATDAYIQFMSTSAIKNGKIHVRNISIVKIADNTILLEKVVPTSQKLPLPKIQFKKINPTRYLIHVSNATKPYSLVFSEMFSNNWKLIPQIDNVSTKGTASESYFNGEVSEEKHTNVFFNLAYLQTAKSQIPEVRHSVANGYANVWNIQPEDVKAKKDYDLLLVYKPQISEYYYLAVSFLVAFGLLIYVIISKNRK